MSSSLAALRGLKLNTLPIRLAVMLAIEPSSNRMMSYATQAKNCPGLSGPPCTLNAWAGDLAQAVSRSVHTTVQVAVLDSPATAAAASTGSTPSCGVMRNRQTVSVALGT